MKNQFFLMIIFSLTSNVAYSMAIVLDEVSKAKLIEQVKKENVNRGYWPSDVVVRLEEFYKMPDNGSNSRYFVRAVGSYNARAEIEFKSGDKKICSIPVGKGTEGVFSEEELKSLGIQVSEQK